MKRILVLLLSILFTISVSGCDSSLEIVGMEIQNYPNRIVYFSGVDKELDLTGGVVNYILKGNSKTAEDMVDRYITVSHHIDFNKPGVYVVELKRGTALCKFPIQVIDKKWVGNSDRRLEQRDGLRMLKDSALNEIGTLISICNERYFQISA